MNRKVTVLIVDNRGQLKLAHDILEQERVNILTADSGEEALNVLESTDADLVISAVQLSGMSGSELLHEIREWDRELPVILVGISKESSDGIESHAFALLPQRYRKDSLLKVVHRALDAKESLTYP